MYLIAFWGGPNCFTDNADGVPQLRKIFNVLAELMHNAKIEVYRLIGLPLAKLSGLSSSKDLIYLQTNYSNFF